MRCKVTLLRDKGKRNPEGKKLKVFEGELGISQYLHPVLGRLVKEAALVEDNGMSLCPPIVDAEIISISAEGFTLRGLENASTPKGIVEFAQEWYCRPVVGK